MKARFCPQMLATARAQVHIPPTVHALAVQPQAVSRATGRFDGECSLLEAAECQRQC